MGWWVYFRGGGRGALAVADAWRALERVKNERGPAPGGGRHAHPRDATTHPVLRVEARVDDPVHVEVEVVELDAVGVRARRVDGRDPRRARARVGPEHARRVLDAVDDDLGVALAEPAVEGGDPHGFLGWWVGGGLVGSLGPWHTGAAGFGWRGGGEARAFDSRLAGGFCSRARSRARADGRRRRTAADGGLARAGSASDRPVASALAGTGRGSGRPRARARAPTSGIKSVATGGGGRSRRLVSFLPARSESSGCECAATSWLTSTVLGWGRSIVSCHVREREAEGAREGG